MDFLNKPKDNSHKKAVLLVLIIIILVGISVLWQYASVKFKNFVPARKVDIVLDKDGTLVIDEKEDLNTKKEVLFTRLSKVVEKPLTPEERKIVITHFSDATKMNLTIEEKNRIVAALNNK